MIAAAQMRWRAVLVWESMPCRWQGVPASGVHHSGRRMKSQC
jgi:hypothetical protein